MKITGVTTILAHPGVGKNLCFVKIDTDEGIHGWGSVTPSRTGTYRS
jgi:L-alanine-DL-glutamate epimerase-like enolase superfamily enzyme